jgi:hypothetical protein
VFSYLNTSIHASASDPIHCLVECNCVSYPASHTLLILYFISSVTFRPNQSQKYLLPLFFIAMFLVSFSYCTFLFHLLLLLYVSLSYVYFSSLSIYISIFSRSSSSSPILPFLPSPWASFLWNQVTIMTPL